MQQGIDSWMQNLLKEYWIYTEVKSTRKRKLIFTHKPKQLYFVYESNGEMLQVNSLR